jgi:hypothetical protein
MHHQAVRRPHPYAGIKNVNARRALGIEPVQRRSGTHAGNNRLADQQILHSQLAQHIGLTVRVDPVTYPNKLARLHESGQTLARDHRQ